MSDALQIDDFLKSDRQWTRSLRIAHAKYQVKRAKKRKDADGMTFWKEVITRNEDD